MSCAGCVRELTSCQRVFIRWRDSCFMIPSGQASDCFFPWSINQYALVELTSGGSPWFAPQLEGCMDERYLGKWRSGSH